MVPTDIGPLPSDLWELLGEPIPPAPEPKKAAPTAVATATSPATSQRQPEATQPQMVDFVSLAPTAPPAATAVTSEPPKPLAKPVSKPTVSLNPLAFLGESDPAKPSATASPVVQRMPEAAPAKPTTLPQADAASGTAVPQRAAPPNQPDHIMPHRSNFNSVPLEQALQLAPAPAAASTSLGESATLTPQPQPTPQPKAEPLTTPKPQAIQAIEHPQPTVVQRFPEVGTILEGMETAVAAPLTAAASTVTPLLDESEPETESEPASTSDLDLDELSRQVYQSLKRKLAIERERGYGR